MKKFASNDNLISLIQKQNKETMPIDSINKGKYLANRNLTIYELEKLFNKEINENQMEEIFRNNNINNKINLDYFRDYICNKNNKKKYCQSKLYNPRCTDINDKTKKCESERRMFCEQYKNKYHSKKQKTKNNKSKMTYSLDYKIIKKNEYGGIEREYKEDIQPQHKLDNCCEKGLKKKTFQILENSTPNKCIVVNKCISTGKKKYDKFSENVIMRNCQKNNKKIEYEKQFNDINCDQHKLYKNKKFKSFYNNCQFEESEKGTITPYHIKNFRCKIQLNEFYNPNKYTIEFNNNKNKNNINIKELNGKEGFVEENNNNYYINTINNNNKCKDFNLNNELSSENNLYSNYNMKNNRTNDVQNEYYFEKDYCNDLKKINSPMGYISTYSTGSDDNKQIIQYYQNCLTENNININERQKMNKNNQLTYQLEDPNDYIDFKSIDLKNNYEINKNDFFEIGGCNKNLKDFSAQIIPHNVEEGTQNEIYYPIISNTSFTIYPNKKKFNNAWIQNNLDEEINYNNLRNKQLQIKIAKEKLLYIKGKNKPKNKISIQDSFKINKDWTKYKEKGTDMDEIDEYTISYNEEFSIINDNEDINRRRDLLMLIVLKTILRDNYLLKTKLIEWYNRAMKMLDLEEIMKRKKLKIKRIGGFDIFQKISKKDKCCGNDYIPNKIVNNLRLELINYKKKKDKGILADIPNRFNIGSLKRRKINDIFCESNKANIDQMRINEILIKLINKKASNDSILKKYLSIWYRKSQYIPLLENAQIIIDYCRSKLNYILTIKRWKKLYKKYLVIDNKKNKKIILYKLKIRKKKLFELIKITRLMQMFNIKKFLRYIILCWFINTNSTITKKNQMKILYENMLTTYVSIADDMFGNNKKNNPSIQYSIIEAVDSDRYQTKNCDEIYAINNQKYLRSEIEKEKKYGFYEKYMNKYFSTVKYNHKNKNEESKYSFGKRGISYGNKNDGGFKKYIKYVKKEY